MYIPVDREKKFRLPVPTEDGDLREHRAVKCVTANRDKTFVAVVTADSIYIWLAQPHLLLCVLSISAGDVIERGTLNKAYWRPDSTHIAITTSRNHILIYRVDVTGENCYNLVDPNDSNFRRTSQELFLRGQRPVVTLSPSVVVNLAAPSTCCVPLRDELFVCIRNGFAHHISWDGTVHADYSVRLTSVPFAHDQLQSKPEFISDASIHIVEAVSAPLIGGYCTVFSDGRAALFTSSDSSFHPNSLLGVWALNMRDACCTDVNHKFRLLIFGCKNGDVSAYHLDDANGALVQTFRIALTVRNGHELLSWVGSVSRVQVLSNGGAIAAIWSSSDGNSQCNGIGLINNHANHLPPTLAIFTPFGAQTWCSLESIVESSHLAVSYTSVEWGPEGFHLWLGRTDGLSIQTIAHSAALGNPNMEHSERVVLLCSSRILISPRREREDNASAPHAVWSTLNAPHDYLASNWPIRFASLEHDFARTLVIAGDRGLAHCNIDSGRWKIFGNESQESSMIVTGGVFVWEGTVGAACYDKDSDRDQLRFYPLNTKLDNHFVSTCDMECRVIMISRRINALVTFDLESKISLFRLKRVDSGGKDEMIKVSLDRLVVIRADYLITYPSCLVSIQLTQLSLDSASAMFFPGVDTVLVNVSGRLFTLNPKNISKDDTELSPPITVASFVEQVWHDRAVSDEDSSGEGKESRHLSNALWINCGSKGMKVWLPLLPGRRGVNSQDTSFISKRIMLPFELDIYPCVMCASDCLALGVESTPCLFSNSVKQAVIIYSLQRNGEVFVHHLLRQLLKRNLGVFALEVAAACRRLPHFSHSLELLLHGVLEEEATSSEPIPDPLLPRCVAFIQEFPEFLRTVAHCARKTELALWSSLFDVTGSPNELFEVCIRDGQLQTAASYLIVLQNIENVQTSLEQAARLLREALTAGEWGIVSDMVRFARAIDMDDMESSARTPPPQKPSSRRPTTSISEANDLVFARFHAAGRITRVRHSHSDRDQKESHRKDSTGSGGGSKKVISDEPGPPSPISHVNPMAEKIDQILDEHAARLLEEYCIRDLGFFMSALCLEMPRLLSSPMRRVVSDFPLALTRLHSQFTWPYPRASQQVFDYLEKCLDKMKISRSAASLNGLSLADSSKQLLNRSETGEYTAVNSSEDLVLETDYGDGDSISIEEARLVPVKGHSSESLRSRPQSPASSSVTQTVSTSDMRSTADDWKGLYGLVGESNDCGPLSCLAQMTHMLRLFADAGCIDWVFLICVISQGKIPIQQEISVETIARCGVDSFKHIKFGCLDLIDWAEQNCVGYAPMLHRFSTYLDMVAEQSGWAILPPRILERKRSNNEKKANIVPPVISSNSPSSRTMHTRSRTLRESFALSQRRERSRSVDRAADHFVGYV